MSHQIAAMFPTLVSLVAYERAAEFNPRARTRLDELERQGAGVVKDGQWQSGHELHKDPVFRELADFVNAAVAARFEALRYEPAKLAITGFWGNTNRPGYQHMAHAHSNNFISGVYYVSAPENAGGIIFQDPRKQAQVLVPTIAELTDMNSTAIRLPAVEGQMILFPSWLEHFTETNRSDSLRISIAFNLMLTGGFGSPETFAGGFVQP